VSSTVAEQYHPIEAASRISARSLETIPGATSSAEDTIAQVAGAAGSVSSSAERRLRSPRAISHEVRIARGCNVTETLGYLL
jgi:hypothetical protein